MPVLSSPLIKGDKISSKADYRDALPENMLAVQRNILNASGYLISHPGLESFAVGAGIDRGGYWNERQNSHFRVSGNQLISIDVLGNVTSIGLISGSKRASLVHSFDTQAIVEDGKMWLYDGAALTQVTDADLGAPIDITWIDGYYFLTDGEFIYHTNLGDEFQIDPLKFATAEFSPDPTLAVDKTSSNQVIVFGRYSIEYFENRATENFAFRRIRGKAIKVGIVGTHCETEMEGRFYIIGGGREESISIHSISSGTYQSIATREIDKILSEYKEGELSQAILETRVQDRDSFLIAQLPNHTLIYNATIARSLGKEYAWTIVKSGLYSGSWRAVNGVYDPRISKWVYGDKIDARIGILDNEIGSQYGELVESILYTPFINIEGASINKLEIDTLPGHQINVDDINCSFSVTYDGIAYSKEWFRLYGEKNNYSTRFIARRFGYVNEYFGIKIRCVSKDRVGFTFLGVDYG